MIKYLKQFAIIILVTLCGELLKYFLPFKIPSSIYGLSLMFLLLMSKIIKVEDVKESSQFLLEIMPIMFIPPTLSLLNHQEALKTIWLPLLLAGTLGTLAIIFVSGRMTQRYARLNERTAPNHATNDTSLTACACDKRTKSEEGKL